MDDFFTVDATGATLHIPALPNGLVTALTLAALGAGFFLFLTALNYWPHRRKLYERLGQPLANFKRALQGSYLWVFLPLAIAAILWAFVSYLWHLPALIGGVLDLLQDSIGAGGENPRRTFGIRNLAYAFAALAGALAVFATIPFQLIRVWINERNTYNAEQNLTTGLINTAVEGLGAQKAVSRLGRTVTLNTGKYEEESLWVEQGEKFEIPAKSQLLSKGQPKLVNDQNGEFVTITEHNLRIWPSVDAVIHWHNHDLKKQTETDSIASTGNWEVFTETLPNIEVRIGAIYALERIAQDSDRDHVRIMEILCAYIRENAPASGAVVNPLGPWPNYPEDPCNGDMKKREKLLEEREVAREKWITKLQTNHTPRADIQAAIEVIGRRTDSQIALEQKRKHRKSDQPYRLDLRKVNLQAADLSNLDLKRAVLAGARLEGAGLFGAHLARAELFGADLEGANLSGARLEGAVLLGANLEGVDLGEAHLERTVLFGAHLEGADLGEAHLERASLYGARLEGAQLGGARLEMANLGEAHLEGADLSEAHFSDETSFRPTTLRGAGLKDVDMTIPASDPNQLPQLLAEAFGDASVTLPDGLEAGKPPLEHWSTANLEWGDWLVAWSTHQSNINYTPPKP